jgi:prepilin-type N-terminal cleavage/methylation domain-containing protein
MVSPKSTPLSMSSRRRPGFTLIELLTAIAIIGVLAAALFPAIGGIRKRARQSSAQTAFSQWASALSRYKQTYGFYPNIGATYSTTTDTLHDLGDAAVNGKFVRALSGRQPTGTALSVADRRLLNRNAEEFVAFGKDDFEDPTNFSDASRLVDRFNNRRIRVIFDTDNNTSIRNINPPGGAASLPGDLSNMATASGIPARIIIYTTDLGDDFESFDGLGASDFAQVFAIQ